VNSIYYAVDDPQRPRSHETGIPARVGRTPPTDGLLMIQGPLLFDWSNRKWGIAPRLENGNLSTQQPATLERLRLWCGAGICVQGNADWIFVKLYTHGVENGKMKMILGEPMRRFHEALRNQGKEVPEFKYYYVTAREMAGLVHQAELGRSAPDWTSLESEMSDGMTCQVLMDSVESTTRNHRDPVTSIQAN
jgi:hypothetical protein